MEAADQLSKTLDHVVSCIPDAAMTVSRELTITRMNASAEDLYGVEAQEIIGRHFTVLTPEPAQAEVAALLAAVFDGLPAPQYRGPRIRPDGTEIIVSISAAPLDSTELGVSQLLAIVRDITHEVAERNARRAAEIRLQRTFDEALIATALWELDGRTVLVNDAACSLLQRSREELLHFSWDEFTHPEDLGDGDAVIEHLLDPETADRHVREKRYILPDGSVMWAQVQCVLVRHRDGSPSHFVGQVQDITAQRREESRLLELASHDDLTGLLNRRGLQMALDAHMVGAREHDQNGSLIVVDLDNFKGYNDKFGHPAGDRLLTCVGEALSANLRETDLIARFGGDEFVAMLPQTDREQALAAAEKLLVRVAEAAAQATGPIELPITASIGIACFQDVPSNTPELIEAADRAMYAAKNAGKNQVAFHASGALRA